MCRVQLAQLDVPGPGRASCVNWSLPGRTINRPRSLATTVASAAKAVEDEPGTFGQPIHALASEATGRARLQDANPGDGGCIGKPVPSNEIRIFEPHNNFLCFTY